MKAVKAIIFVLVVVGLIWLIVFLLGKAFTPSTKNSTKTNTPSQSLSRFADDNAAETIMYIDGPVQIDQSHEALRITVSRMTNKIEYITGYEGTVARQEVFPSNKEAYAAFLKSLDKAGFAKSVSTKVSEDERGYCPLRNRFIYTQKDGNKEVVRTWTSSCNVGNYTGNQSLTRQLFLNQIPYTNLQEILRGTKLSTV